MVSLRYAAMLHRRVSGGKAREWGGGEWGFRLYPVAGRNIAISPMRSFAVLRHRSQAAKTATFLRAAAASSALSQDANGMRLRIANSR